MSPSSVPPQVPSSGRPLPFRRVLWGEFPDLTGTISRLRLLASPRASLRFLRSALPPLRPSSLPRGATTLRRPGPLLPRRPRRLFLDNPCVHAPLSDPGGPPTPGHYSAGDGVFRTDDYVDSAMMLISGLNHAACTLPVYASRPRSPQDAQHSVPAGGQPWPGRTLACGVAQKVSVMSIPLHGIPLHQALPGARRVAAGSCLPAAPTDPDVPNSGIRPLGLGYRYSTHYRVHHANRGEWVEVQYLHKTLPRHAPASSALVQPLLPLPGHCVSQPYQCACITGDSVIGVVCHVVP